MNVDAGNDGIALFELARVYLPSGEQLPDERWRVGGIAEGGFAAARGAVEVDLRRAPPAARAAAGGAPVPSSGQGRRDDAGWLGELHPALLEGTWGVFELDVGALMAPIPERILYDDVITFPPLRQDLAVVVAEDVEAAALVDAALEAGAPSSARRASSTSTGATRWARAGSPSRSTSRSRRPTGRCPTTTLQSCGSGSSPP